MNPDTDSLALTVGPLLYWWPRAAVMDFYADVATSAARTVVLGEVVCSRRNDFKFDDWIALARDLRAAGKEVILATQALLMSEAELRSAARLVEQGEFPVEAGDTSALSLLAKAAAARPDRAPFVLGPHINVYSRDSLVEHAKLGAGRWVAPLELSLDAIEHVHPVHDPVQGTAGPILTEVFGFGRMPLAFSARCFTARHHRLTKDACDFRCRQDADGLLLSCTDGAPFLVLNGIQTQSAGVHCLVAEAQRLRQAGIASVRLSPCGTDFLRVIEVFDAAYHHGLPPADALKALATLKLPGTLVDGFAHQRPGIEEIAA